MDDASRFNPARYSHWIDDHVRFSDLDPLGHVNNNAIGQYFENARAALFYIVTPEWPWHDQIFVLAQSTITYRRELRMPARLRIGSCVTRIGRSSMHIASALYHETQGIALCETVSVMIDDHTRKPVPIPDDVRSALTSFADAA